MTSVGLCQGFQRGIEVRFSRRATDSQSGYVSIDRRAGQRVFSD
jgi:hypothetical protein